MYSEFSGCLLSEYVVEYVQLVVLPVGVAHAARKVSFGVGKL